MPGEKHRHPLRDARIKEDSEWIASLLNERDKIIDELEKELEKQNLYAELGEFVYNNATDLTFGDPRDLDLAAYLAYNEIIDKIKQLEGL